MTDKRFPIVPKVKLKRGGRGWMTAVVMLLTPLWLGAQAPPPPSTQFGTLVIRQNDNLNTSTSITMFRGPGGTLRWEPVPFSSSRGDYAISFLNENDFTSGALIASVAQNGRNNNPFGDTIGQFYATVSVATFAGVDPPNAYYIATDRAAQGTEVNINVSFGYFPYDQWLGGTGWISDRGNGLPLDRFNGSPGLALGSSLIDIGSGVTLLDLRTVDATATPSNGVLLVNHAKNEDNYGSAVVQPDGTWQLRIRDNGSNGTGTEQDPVTFVYFPVLKAGTAGLQAIGRVNNDATTDVAAGTFTVTKGPTGIWYLEIPGANPNTGTLLVSGEGAGNMSDNIVSSQWDPVNSRWEIQVRDIVSATALPVLENGATPAEDIFSFVFFAAPILPDVIVTAPTEGQSFTAPASFTVTADASDFNGNVAQVEFFRNGRFIGVDTEAPYSVEETGLPGGRYQYVARATDNEGLAPASTPVSAVVRFDPLNPPANTALFFDGLVENATMNPAPELGLGGPPTGQFTLECWFRKEGPGATASSGVGGIVVQPLFSKGRGESDNNQTDTNYLVGVTPDGQLAADFEAFPSPGVTGGANFPVIGAHPAIEDGRWYHAAVTYESTTGQWRLFLDGVQVGSRQAQEGAMPRYDSNHRFSIGAAMNTSVQRAGSFYGAIDEVRAWNYARTAAEIQSTKDAAIVAAPGLIGRFGLNEGSGVAVASSVGTITGQVVGPVDGDGLPVPGWQPLWVEGAPLTNEAPTLSLLAPLADAVFTGTTPILLAAEAADADGTVTKVEFFDGASKLAELTAAPYEFLWTGAPAGPRTVRAVATDDKGALTVASAMIQVNPRPSLLLTEVQSSQSAGAPSGAADYWELTNTGPAAISLAGYTWHDSGRNRNAALGYALPAGTEIAAGESILFTPADPAVFRTWWGLAPTVRVIQSAGAPGLGQNDGVALYDGTGAEVFFFSYASGGFTRSNGLPALGGHAGESGGGSATAALVWDPASGVSQPRYTAAESGVNGGSLAGVGADVGSPGTPGGGAGDPAVLLSVAVAPGLFSESTAGAAAVGTVRRRGDVSGPLTVRLVSGDVSEATVPAVAVILAGQDTATFDVTAVDDILADGDQTILIAATADNAVLATTTVTVLDDADVPPPALLLTEIQSSNSGAAGAADYWELTNYGTVAVDLTGFTWDDDSRSYATGQAWAFPLGTTIAAGESVIITAADPAAFRTWWGIANTVQVLQSIGSPGLGQNDGISLFDNTGRELFHVSYAAGGFTRTDGTAAAGGHAGVSAGGAETDALVWDPTSGVQTPRYLAAVVGEYGAVQAATGTDVGSPGGSALGTPVSYTLQLLHLADAEAGLLASQTAPNLAALVDAFEEDYSNTLILAGGDNFIPSSFLNAGTDPAINAVAAVGATAFGRPDMAIHNLIGVEASAIGNHEWDLGSNVFVDAIRPAGAWAGAQFPHLSLNLDYSRDSAALGRFTDVALDGAATAVPKADTLKGRLVPVAVVEKGGEKIGLVGVTTQLLNTISSPSGTVVKGGSVENLDLLAAQIQPYVDELEAEGVNKIVLLAHLQQLSNERALAGKLRGVDVILAAGSNTRLGDSDDVAAAFPGHAANFADSYPIFTEDKTGAPMVIVNTDNEFTYLGRLVLEFDLDGQLLVEEIENRTAINGAYPSTAANVAAAWGVAEGNLGTTAFAAGTKGARVKEVTEAVQSVINAKDGQVHGYTAVYLEGERSFVRGQETNLGNLTADANQAALRAITGGTGPIVSLKNGGGIRAQIGAVSNQGGTAVKGPPPPNPVVGKAAGGISQLDIENALRFNNRLMVFETTPAGLKAILEHGVALWPNQGRFPQIGGVQFAWDPALPAGERITSIALAPESGAAIPVYRRGGTGSGVLPTAPAIIQVVTLNFLANDGDGYPMKANGSNFRYLLSDGTLGPVIADEGVNFTVAPQLPGNALGEQSALAGYLQARHGSQALAYREVETPASEDLRIQNLSVRGDTVPPLAGVDTDGDGITDVDEIILGSNPRAGTRVGDRLSLDLGLYAAPGETFRLVGKLPLGLRFDPVTGLLSGVIAGLPGLYDLQLQVLNGSAIVKAVSLRLAVNAFPSRLLANYEALLEDGSGNPTGMLRLTMTKPGAWTGTLDLKGAPRRSSKGMYELVAGQSATEPVLSFKAAGLNAAVNLSMRVDAETPLVSGTFTAGAVTGTVRGLRLAGASESPPLTRRLGFGLDAGVQNGVDYPAGFGWLRGSLSNAGTVNAAGMLGDAQTMTLAVRKGVTGQAIVWAQPYRNKQGYFGGVLGLPALGQPTPTTTTLTAGCKWFKAADVREKSYASGFAAPLSVTGWTSGFVPPVNAEALGTQLGLTGGLLPVEIEGAGLSNAPGGTPGLPEEFALAANFGLTVQTPLSLAPWTGRVNKIDGSLTGTLTLPATTGTLAGRAAVSGVLLPDLAGSSTGAGLIRVPVAGAPGAFRTAALLIQR